MGYCVIDFERIKGNLIYLFSYQLYSEDFSLIESKTFLDESIALDNRKSPKRKAKLLRPSCILISSFEELYSRIEDVMLKNELIVFSKTDIGVIRKNLQSLGRSVPVLTYIDLQEALFKLSDSPKHKSNLKDYCKDNSIRY